MLKGGGGAREHAVELSAHLLVARAYRVDRVRAESARTHEVDEVVRALDGHLCAAATLVVHLVSALIIVVSRDLDLCRRHCGLLIITRRADDEHRASLDAAIVRANVGLMQMMRTAAADAADCVRDECGE